MLGWLKTASGSFRMSAAPDAASEVAGNRQVSSVSGYTNRISFYNLVDLLFPFCFPGNVDKIHFLQWMCLDLSGFHYAFGFLTPV